MIYNIDIRDDYSVPAGPLTKEQYVEFVMNRAAESYKNRYSVDSFDAGVTAACDVYNQSVTPPADNTPA